MVDETIRAIPQIPRGEIPAALVKVLDAMKEDIEILSGLRDPQYIVNYVISGGSSPGGPVPPSSGVGTGDTVTLDGDVIGIGVFDALGDVEVPTVIDLPNLICIDGGASDTIYTSQPSGPYGVLGSAGSNLNIRDNGALVTAAAQLLNFVGFLVTQPVPGQVTITAGGAGDQDEKAFNRPGVLDTSIGVARWYPTKDITFIEAVANVGVAPTGQDITVDILINGVVDTTLTIVQSTFLSAAVATTSPVTTTDYVTVNITQVGNSIKGSDLVVNLKYS